MDRFYTDIDTELTATTETETEQHLTEFIFKPVDPKEISDIIGYIALGLSSSENAQTTLFKWHTWMIRMNEWVSQNVKNFPEKISIPSLNLPANYYFLGTTKPLTKNAQLLQTITTCPLGPLLPNEMQTLMKSLDNGLIKTRKDAQIFEAYRKWLDGLNHAAQYAVDQNLSVQPVQFTGDYMSIPIVPINGYFTDMIETFTDVAKGTSVQKWVLILLSAFVIYFLTSNRRVQSGGMTDAIYDTRFWSMPENLL